MRAFLRVAGKKPRSGTARLFFLFAPLFGGSVSLTTLCVTIDRYVASDVPALDIPANFSLKRKIPM
ncbi:hypothetical protein [Comamonas sp. BIGb0124]|uniref:hypothetical protein n=1 Tax=Comamonas sp. BIGb0124 TaxID=2485130 RepID=UPI0011CE610C|nr:hypothetical protein [Comamonas sp. BIGb0124]